VKRALFSLAALVLIAATPGEALPGLEADGYFIEPGSDATEQVVSDAVFEGRADGGRLYIVVLAEEPPGGAPTFSDSTLDLLDGDGYVVTVAPQTVGFAGGGTSWTVDEMNSAVDAALDGGSDDEVVEIFIATLVDQPAGGGSGGDDSGSSGGGIPWTWILLLGGGGFLLWWYFTNRSREMRSSAGRMAQVKEMAKEKLAEVANDILEMEDEVTTSENSEVKEHYQRASATYSQAMEDTEHATTVAEMMKVSEELDLAIWELDCAEALLDGKPKPPKPEPPPLETVTPPQQPVPPAPTPSAGYDRRPERQSGGSNDMLSVLLTMMAMNSMRGGGGFGGSWTGSGGGAPRPPTGGGGFGRIRGGGRRRG